MILEYLYIDESGSMTANYCNNNPYFVISIVRVLDKKMLHTSMKRFVRKNWNKLKSGDRTHKMFNGDKFLELKGSAMTKEMKKAFVAHLIEKKSFEVFYIVLDNRKVDMRLYKNTARAFNFMIKLAIHYFLTKRKLRRSEEILIQIDERNERPEAKLHLQEYLNTELQLNEDITQEITVNYFDSCNNSIIQLADFFANLKYSQLQTREYDAEFKKLLDSKILSGEFKFPKT